MTTYYHDHRKDNKRETGRKGRSGFQKLAFGRWCYLDDEDPRPEESYDEEDYDALIQGDFHRTYFRNGKQHDPQPVFSNHDCFEFPPNSPERKRLEEVRKGILERWAIREQRRQNTANHA